MTSKAQTIIGTLEQAIAHFQEYENCRRFLVAIRWAGGPVKCPTCGSEKVTYLANARLWKCYAKHGRAKFSLKTGTILEGSPIGLEKWLATIWMLANCRSGIGAADIQRVTGVTRKTAWFMLQRGRLALQDLSSNRPTGEVELDEAFIGGKALRVRRKRRSGPRMNTNQHE